jgi:hypothetical protein
MDGSLSRRADPVQDVDHLEEFPSLVEVDADEVRESAMLAATGLHAFPKDVPGVRFVSQLRK